MPWPSRCLFCHETEVTIRGLLLAVYVYLRMVKNMRTYLHFLIFLGLACFVAGVAVAEGVQISNVRLGISDVSNNTANKTRIVLDVGAHVKPKVFTLPNPHRVVLDFPTLTFNTDLSDVNLDARGVVKAMRQGLFKPDTTRVVLDVKTAVDVHVFDIPPTTLAGKPRPRRIVIDLTRKTGAAKPTIKVAKGKVTTPKQANETKPKATAAVPVQQKPAPVIRKTKSKPKGPFIVVIDPGHGGVDPGAVGKKKTYEKHVVLETSKRLKTELEKQPNTKVYLTRTSDKFVKLGDRTAFAQRRDADIFISVHADAHHVRTVKGGSVYVLSEKASDKEAARLADNANKGDLFAGLDISDEPKEVQNILIDLTRRETKNRSVRLANEVLQDLGKAVHLRKKEALFAGFKVLKAPEIPSILIEMTYLSNLKEEKLLNTSSHQTKIAKAVAAGVKDYRRKFEGR